MRPKEEIGLKNMPDQNTQNQSTSAAEENNFQRLDLLFSQMPDHVYSWLFSEQAAKNIMSLGKKFRLSESRTLQMSQITGLAILKEFSLPNMVMELKKVLNFDDMTTRQLAIDIALSQFLPIRDHMQGIESFIKQLGGTLPATLPPLLKTSLSPTINYKTTVTPAATPAPAITVVQKSLRQLAQDYKDALNQNLTGAPIRVADFDQPVRPTIKNWLVDYVKIKGAGHHESLERSDYLFNSANAKSLPERERAIVAEILRAYDDDLPLPFDEQSQTILLENLTAAPKTTRPTPSSAGYREPISQNDLTGPFKQAPPRPTPKISGNIIDLKDLQ